MVTTLLKMTLGGAVLIAVIVLIRLVGLSRLPKRLFPVLWCVALLRLLTPLSVPVPAGVSLPALPVPDGAVIQPTDTVSPAIPGGPVGAELLPDTAAPLPAPPAAAPRDAGRFPLVPTVWAAVGLGLGIYFLLSRGRLCRELKTAVPVENEFALRWLAAHGLRRRVELRELTGLPSPMTYGIVRPVILVPRGFDWSDRAGAAYVLYHEYTHIRRFDAALKLLMAAALCLHWFNPLVWVMYFLLDRDLELACDEAVLRYYGPGRRRSYAETIIGMEEKRALPAPFGSFFSKNTAEERIRAIMRFKKNSVIALALAVVLVIAGAVTVFATAGNEDKTPPSGREDADTTDAADTADTGDTAGNNDTTEARAPAGGLVYSFTYGNLQLQVAGVRETRTESGYDDGGEYVSCPVYILEPGAVLTVLEADMFEDTEGARHGDWALYTTAGEYIYIVDDMAPVALTTDILGVVDPESSLYVLAFAWDAPGDQAAAPSRKLTYFWGSPVREETVNATLYALDGCAIVIPDSGWARSGSLYGDGLDDVVRWSSGEDASLEIVNFGQIGLDAARETVTRVETEAGYTVIPTKPGGLDGEWTGADGILNALSVSFYESAYSAFAVIERWTDRAPERTAAELWVFANTFEARGFTMMWAMDHAEELSDRELTVFAARSDGAYAEAAGHELARRFLSDPRGLLNALAADQSIDADRVLSLLVSEFFMEERVDDLGSALRGAAALPLTGPERAVLEELAAQYDLSISSW